MLLPLPILQAELVKINQAIRFFEFTVTSVMRCTFTFHKMVTVNATVSIQIRDTIEQDTSSSLKNDALPFFLPRGSAYPQPD